MEALIISNFLLWGVLLCLLLVILALSRPVSYTHLTLPTIYSV